MVKFEYQVELIYTDKEKLSHCMNRSAKDVLLKNKMSTENNALSMENSDMIHSGQEKIMFENTDEAAKYAAERRSLVIICDDFNIFD